MPATLVYPRLCLAVIALALASLGLAQAAPEPQHQEPASASEISSYDEIPTFKVKVNVVLVRVIVRDAQGHAIGTLKREDFQLFDNKKPQTITSFTVERPGTQVAREEKTSETEPTQTPTIAERYIAYLFDDIHLNTSDLMQVRLAAERHLSSLATTDRAAIYSTSGQTTLDFTDDRTKLRDTVLRLRSTPIAGSAMKECPDVSYYMADMIENKNDPRALQAATYDALGCAFGNDPSMLRSAQSMAVAAAARELQEGDHETQITLDTLKNVVRRMSVLPGQRTVILASPGFYNPEQIQEESDIIDRALHANVIVSALDARGLYVDSVIADASQPGPSNVTAGVLQQQFGSQAASIESDILAEFAYGTGGAFFHNNNDLEEGFRRLAAAPEYYYLLSFSPQNLKLDGKYHNLKVTLNAPQNLSVQARRGYYAPKKIPDVAEQAKQEIQDALFSQEEMHELPVDLHTQFFKTTDTDAKLAVLAHLDVKRLHFRRVDDRNGNELTVVSAIFDRNGQFVSAVAKLLTMRLRDETLEKKLQSGLTMKSSFDVKPGSYLVRLVVRDAEGDISAENGAIEIP
jgi:VWFA-related protein